LSQELNIASRYRACATELMPTTSNPSLNSRWAIGLDGVKHDDRFTDNHLGRSAGMIVADYSVMVVAPLWLSLAD
jgi:hypothetical protein